jgi:amino acid adenylation domain-containing protein
MYDKTYSSDMAAAASQYYNERAYWLEKLSGDLVKSTFPIDLKAPGKKRKIEAVPLRFSGEVVEKLLWMSNESDSRLLVLLTTGLAALIQTYTNNNDIIVGTPIYKQPVEGKFLNTVLTLRNRVEGNMNFKELLYQVKQTIDQAVKNQNYPLKSLLYELNVPYSEEDFPLFDIALMVENIQERKYIHHIQTNMMFSFSRVGNRLDGRLEYNSEVYIEETAERICSHFNRLLEQLLFHVDTPLSHVDLLSEQEKKRLVEDFNNTRKEAPGTEGVYQADRTLHSLFEEQVERTPDQTAIIFIQEEKKPEGNNGERKKTLTYQQLNEKANGLARVLRNKGVGPERIAALLIESSIPMVTAVLAVLKAGGAYLPIDLEAPTERKTFILKESRAHLVLTDQPGESTSFPVSDLPGHIETLDVSDERVYDPDTTPLDSQTKSSDLAYIIYTSGSTGKPKGVLVEHGHVVNTLVYRKEEYRMDNRHTALQLFSYAFDGFLTSFFTPIISGARVVILSKQTIEDITRIVDVIAENQVTHFISVPILYQAIMKTITKAEAASLQVVTLAGDQVQPHLLELTAAVNKNIEIVNEYGITEAGVMSTVYRHQEKDPRIKIGFPAWNTRIYITRPTNLDDRQLLSVGVYGEMCIAGAGVARGYMNNPGLTAARFTEDPFLPDRLGISGNGRHRRMLKTGDMARRLPDGNIEFMGRIDHQVKIRGYRIEPGEIENRLKKHQRIKEAVVIARKNKKNDKYLCAYYVENKTAGETPTTVKLNTSELSDYLAKELPAYMVPTYFVPLEHIPLNANGKIDRGVLPEPKEGTAEKEYVPPQDEVEIHLAEIWQDVLGIKKIGISDNFFDLGGHSLTATMLASRIHKAFHVKIPLTKIFVTPTIQGIAGHIKETTKTSKEMFDRIEPAGEKPYYSLSSAQKRLYFLYRLEEAGRGYNMSQALILEGDLNIGRVETVFKKMIERHESLRTSFYLENSEPVQKVHKSVEFEIEYQKKPLSKHSPQDLMMNFIRPFDLAQAPLMRMELVKLEEGKHLLMLDMHHIVTDGTSLGIMIKEFALLYKGEELPPLRIGYKDYAQWQTHTRQQAVIKEQEAYWMRSFSQEVPVLDLPSDFPRPAIKSFQGSLLDFSFAEEETRKLKALAKEADATLYMTLLALFNILLSKLSGQEDIVIGTPTAGRRHADVEPIVGMFINTLALRNYPLAGKTGMEFLKEVKACTLKAFENQEYPFEDLVDRLAVRRDTGRNPIFDVLFALQNMDVSPSEISGLKLIPCDYETGISKFDLNLNGYEERNQLSFSFEYSTALFKEETIQRFIQYFREIVSSVTAEPQLAISRIEILNEEERRQVLYECNDTAADYPTDKTIHRLFEDQAAKTPDKIAITAAPSNNMSYPSYLSYKHLDQESNRLACLLRAKGVTTGCIAAIMAERSMEMAVGLFGILKAGGAYLPIEPQYPEERKQYMLADSAAKILLTGPDDIPEGTVGLAPLYLPFADHPATRNPQLATSPENPAYVIYTSGTTGTPKGVVINHSNVVNGIWFRKEEYKIDTSDVCLQMFSYSFDGFVTSFFTPLISGAAVVLLSEEQLADIKKIKEAIVNNKVTHFICVPPLYHAIIEYLSPVEASTLRVVTLAGDKVSPKTLAITREKNPNMEIANEYGVTEASVLSSIYRHQEKDDVIKIGKPISNTQLYVLDKEGKPQPKGVPGELCIGGVGVSSGYLGNPELTTEKFNRSHTSYMSYWPYLKLYRTGDLARSLPDGTIELLERIDHQLKIRGFRIEAGEIENRLRMKEGIKEALVVAREDKSGDKYLCAYVVPDRTHGTWGMEHGEEAPAVLAEELREFLSKTLPGYMIPSYFIPLEKFPLNPNGKIDRKALPEPEVKTGGEYIAPSNENEEKLVQIWADVLGLEKEKIGVNDNFFDLGGNSLKVMQVSGKLKETFQQDIPVIAMFQHTTIGSFAHYLNPGQTRVQAQPLSSQKDRNGAVNKGKNKLKNLKHKMKELKNGKNE